MSKAAFLISADQSEGKVLYLASIPKTDVSKEFNAKIWLASVADLLKGKGGGKDESGQGIGSEVSKVGEAVELAKKAYPVS